VCVFMFVLEGFVCPSLQPGGPGYLWLLASLSKSDFDGATSSYSAAGIVCEFTDVNNLLTRSKKKTP